MPLLLHLDGLPGVGKTTLARLWVEENPGALCLDIDLLRRSLGGWRDDLSQSGQQARRLAYRVADQHLRDGHDVVVPQYAVSRAFVSALEDVATRAGADFLLVLLRADGEDRDRLDRRTAVAAEPQHVEAGEVIAATGYPPYEALADLVAEVPGAQVLDTRGRTAAQSLDALRDLLRRSGTA